MGLQRPTTRRFEYDRAERWADGVIHGLGIVLGLVAVGMLVAAMLPDPSPSDLIPALIYGVAMIAVLVISAAYNMWPISPVKWWLRRFDHAAIYVLIAGTYTPFLTRMGSALIPQVVMVGVWAASLIGIILKLALPGRFDRLSIGLYLVIGWSGVVLWDHILVFPSATLWLLGAGALLYTTGVIFHVWDSLRFHNAIWHAFVLVATACHYGAVFSSVMTQSV
ncbi:hemolysin III family protein [Microvirga sp. VF16]|uniref:PAQR family membrane homeostasis protein TrhA n=1 Tax=Microvirga sp. VF16 TaxID=2807101 RepID=UPI00193E26C8|nr:hemolysin III family protein [Microvirga sp. VF16]QRM34496.1 hemolysin III family protein [Microvirga sp. VF16]